MSWFSDITGKAENLLTRLDQTAAMALHNDPNAATISQDTEQGTQYTGANNFQYQPSLSYSASVPTNLTGLKQMTGGSNTQSTVKPVTKPTNISYNAAREKFDPDEALFEFLNSAEGRDAKNKVVDSQHSRQSSTSSVISNKSTKMQEIAKPQSALVTKDTHEDTATEPVDVADTVAESSSADETVTDETMRVSLERENRLMKKEMASLNEEMSLIIHRAKNAQDEVVRLKEKVHGYNHSASHADQIVRELQARETDLTQALSAKDSQLAVLRVRLEEADRLLDLRKKDVVGLQTDNDRILQDHSDSAGIHSQALDSLREKLDDAERTLRREQDACKILRGEAAQRESMLETEQSSLTEALAATQKRLDDETGRCNQLNNQLRSCKSNLQVCRQELADYKDKAARILQSKERLIASLREGSGASGESVGVSLLEYDAVKQERDMFREDLQQYKITIDNYKLEIQDLEVGHQTEIESAQDQVRNLEELMSEEKQRNGELTQDVHSHKLEMQYSIEEMNRQKASMQTRIDERERDIERLRAQLTTKSMSCVTETELESRVRALTESLIHKQTTLEALSTEKTSLNLQLERLNHKYQDLQSMPVRNSTTVNVNEDDEVRAKGGGFLREQSGDAAVTRKMKRAANTIDRFSIRLGVFLRRYPIARVFVILYMVFLHAWVTFVLLTYQPEIHGFDPHPKPPQ